MSVAPPSPPPTAGGTRLLALFLVGLFLGAMLSFMAGQILARKAGYQDGLMAVLQHHQTQLRRISRDATCTPQAAQLPLQRLRLLSPDVATALADRGALVQRLNGDLLEAVATDPADCAALRTQVSRIEASCKACHSQLR